MIMLEASNCDLVLGARYADKADSHIDEEDVR